MEYIKIRAFPGAGAEKVVPDAKKLRIFVREPAQAGRANHRIQQILAQHLNILPHQLRLVAGHHSTNKTFQVLTE